MRRYTWMPTLVGGLLGSGLAVLLFSGHPNVDETWLIPNVLGLFVWYVPIAAWHECGHAAVARLVGLRVFAVTIGAGPALSQFHIGGTRVTLSMLPLSGGFTRFAAPPGTSHVTGRAALAVAAGPLNALVLVVVVAAVSPHPLLGLDSPTWFTGPAPLESLQFANVMGVVLALTPMRVAAPAGIVMTDGLLLLQALFARASLLGNMSEAYYLHAGYEHLRVAAAVAALEHYRRGLAAHPESPLIRHDRAVALLLRGEFREARDSFLWLLTSERAAPFVPAQLLKNNIAYCNLMIGDPALLQEADALSREAFDAAPAVAAFRGTRGAVLVQTGRVQEGRRLLLRAHRQHSDPLQRAVTAAWLAVASVRLEDVKAAQGWLTQARADVTGLPEITLAEGEVAKARR